MSGTFPLYLFYVVIGVNFCGGAPGEPHRLKLQPAELDGFEAVQYFQNDKFMRLLLRCVLFDEPCNLMTTLKKPKAVEALLDKCEKCTSSQEKLMKEWFGIFKEIFPEMHKVAVKNFVEKEGTKLRNMDEAVRKQAFSDGSISYYIEAYKEFMRKLPTLVEKYKSRAIKIRSARSVTKSLSRNFSEGNVRSFLPIASQFPFLTPSSPGSTPETNSTTDATPKAPTTPAPPTDSMSPTPVPSFNFTATFPPVPEFKIPTVPSLFNVSATFPPPPEFKIPTFPSVNEFKLPSPTDFIRSADDFKLPSAEDFKLPSSDDFKLPSPTDFKVPSPTDFKVPSPNDFKVPSPTDFKIPSPTDFKVPSPDDFKFPSPNDFKLPSLPKFPSFGK